MPVGADLCQQEVGSALKRESIIGCDPFLVKKPSNGLKVNFLLSLTCYHYTEMWLTITMALFKDAVRFLTDFTVIPHMHLAAALHTSC